VRVKITWNWVLVTEVIVMTMRIRYRVNGVLINTRDCQYPSYPIYLTAGLVFALVFKTKQKKRNRKIRNSNSNSTVIDILYIQWSYEVLLNIFIKILNLAQIIAKHRKSESLNMQITHWWYNRVPTPREQALLWVQDWNKYGNAMVMKMLKLRM
jgi:hypothetical protein